MKTTATTPDFLFPNLYAELQKDAAVSIERFKAELQPVATVAEILAVWYYRELMTKAKQAQNWEPEDLKTYLISRKEKEKSKELDKQLTRLATIANAPDLQSITVNIEWKKNRTWGFNPTAEARVQHINHTQEYYNSGSIGGCGYDKESTSFAQAVNQSNALLKALYLHKEKQPASVNREYFGYGSGYGILPKLEGGVGISCYYSIFEKIGFEMQKISSGKTFDVYTVTKKA